MLKELLEKKTEEDYAEDIIDVKKFEKLLKKVYKFGDENLVSGFAHEVVLVYLEKAIKDCKKFDTSD
jgi:hypothetical protein